MIRSNRQHKDGPGEAAEREAKRTRQAAYLEALQTLKCFEIVEGVYGDRWPKCRLCKKRTWIHEEKQTDVALASRLVADALLDRFDTAIIVSGDADLAPAIRTVREHFHDKPVTVAFPPNRVFDELRHAAETTLHISKAMLRRCQFEDDVIRGDSHVLSRPGEWL